MAAAVVSSSTVASFPSVDQIIPSLAKTGSETILAALAWRRIPNLSKAEANYAFGQFIITCVSRESSSGTS